MDNRLEKSIDWWFREITKQPADMRHLCETIRAMAAADVETAIKDRYKELMERAERAESSLSSALRSLESTRAEAERLSAKVIMLNRTYQSELSSKQAIIDDYKTREQADTQLAENRKYQRREVVE